MNVSMTVGDIIVSAVISLIAGVITGNYNRIWGDDILSE